MIEFRDCHGRLMRWDDDSDEVSYPEIDDAPARSGQPGPAPRKAPNPSRFVTAPGTAARNTRS